MLLNHIILAIAWIVYVVLHSFFASVHFKKNMQTVMGGYYKHYRLFYTLFAFIFLVALVWFQLIITTPRFYDPSLPIIIFGGLVSASGLIIMLICIYKYFMSISGLRSLSKETPTSKLIISGIHRFVRHPLYAGTFLFLWGFLIALPYLSLAIVNIIITVYTLVAIKLEEAKLVAEFGEQYKTYQKTVPRIIPNF